MKNKSSIGRSKAPAKRSGLRTKVKKMRLLRDRRGPLGGRGAQVMPVNAPAATASVTRRAVSNPVTIKMTEEVSDVNVKQAFVNTALIINPGNHELFPWLSIIAKAFTSYEFEMLQFRYVAATTTGIGGDVVLVVNADPDKDPFINEKQALNHEGSAMASPWVSFGINGKQATTQSVIPTKYVADVAGQAGLDGILDDLHTIADGVIQVFTGLKNLFTPGEEAKEKFNQYLKDNGIDKKSLPLTDDAVTTGKLFVDYRIILHDPADEEDPEDNGYNLAAGPAIDLSTYVYGISALATTSPVTQTSSQWNDGWPDAPTGKDACHVLVTNVAASQSYLEFRDPGYYTIEYFPDLGDTNKDFTDEDFKHPSIGTSGEGTATIVTTFARQILFCDEGVAQSDQKGKTPKSNTSPNAHFSKCLGAWFVEITGPSTVKAGQIVLTDAGTGAVPLSHYKGINCYLMITRVQDDVAAFRLKKFAKENIPMSLPDCPINAAIMYLRSENRKKKLIGVNQSVSTHLREKSANKKALLPQFQQPPSLTLSESHFPK